MQLISEIKIHKSLNHQYIVDFEHVFEDHENVYILLEVCPNQVIKLIRLLTSCLREGRDLQNSRSSATFSKS